MTRRRSSSPPAPVQKGNGGNRQHILLSALLFAVTIGLYSQVWEFASLTVDDPAYVSQNPQVQAGITPRTVRWSFTTVHDSNWIPFTWLSLMLDTQLYGVRAGGYHLTNAILHAANAVLLYLSLALATSKPARSAMVASLFALHPLHVESVAWIAERKDVLSTLFGLCSLLAYVCYAKGGRLWSLALSLLFFAGSLLSKQTLVTLPFVFLLLDFWPLERWPLRAVESIARERKSNPPATPRPSLTRLIVEKIPFFAASAVFSAAALMAQSRGGAVGALQGYPLAARFANAVVVYVAYLWKTISPQNLALYYPYPHDGLTASSFGFAAAVLLAITLFAVATIRRLPFVFVGWCWYLGTLVPMIGLVQIGTQQMADRYTYFPLIGIFLAAVWLVPALVPSGNLRTRVLPIASVGIVALYAAISYSQISYWHDSVTLLRHNQDCTPDNSVAHEFLGSALIAQGETREGVAELEIATRIAPNYAPLHLDLGKGLQRLGRLDDATSQYRQALALNDRLVEPRCQLAEIEVQRGNYEAATRHLRRALDIDPTFLKARVDLINVLLKVKNYGEALTESERLLAIDPSLPLGHYCAAMALRGQGRLDEAIEQFQYAVERAPDDRLAKEELDRTRGMKRDGK